MVAQSKEAIERFKRQFRFFKYNGNLENYFNALLYLKGVKSGFTTTGHNPKFDHRFGRFCERFKLPVLKLSTTHSIYYSKEDRAFTQEL